MILRAIGACLILMLTAFPVYAENGPGAAGPDFAVPEMPEAELRAFARQLAGDLGQGLRVQSISAGSHMRISFKAPDWAGTLEILPPESEADFCSDSHCCHWLNGPDHLNNRNWRGQKCALVAKTRLPWRWLRVDDGFSGVDNPPLTETAENIEPQGAIAVSATDPAAAEGRPVDAYPPPGDKSKRYTTPYTKVRPPWFFEATMLSIILLPLFLGALGWFQMKKRL